MHNNPVYGYRRQLVGRKRGSHLGIRRQVLAGPGTDLFLLKPAKHCSFWLARWCLLLSSKEACHIPFSIGPLSRLKIRAIPKKLARMVFFWLGNQFGFYGPLFWDILRWISTNLNSWSVSSQGFETPCDCVCFRCSSIESRLYKYI